MTALVDAGGWVGAALVLGAYAVQSGGRLRRTGLYQLANAVGSAGLGAAAGRHHNWPSAVLNALWLLVAALALRPQPVTREPSAPLPDLVDH